MKIVNILGGLGNQMFQYALALALKEKHPDDEIRIDPSGFKGYPLHNGYELRRIFNVPIREASFVEQMRVHYPLRNYRMWQIGNRILPLRGTTIKEGSEMLYTPTIITEKKSAYYIGYWQSEKYFRDIRPLILNAFVFPGFVNEPQNEELSKRILTKNAVSLHVRRGDYLKINDTQGICTLNYYRTAIAHMLRHTTPEFFLIFSDDIEWCKDNLSELLGETPIEYVNWNKGEQSYRDMQLMSLCKHNIIANSSFSWWGAWLNQNQDKIVITPSRWMNRAGWADVIPDDWHRIIV